MTLLPGELYHETALHLSPGHRKRLVATGKLAGFAHSDGSKSWTGASIREAVAALRSQDGDDEGDEDEDEDEEPVSPNGDEDEEEAEEEAQRELRRARGRRGAAKRDGAPTTPDQLGARISVLEVALAVREEMARSGRNNRIEAASAVARRDPEAHERFLRATNSRAIAQRRRHQP
jgi:hypothetical protein